MTKLKLRRRKLKIINIETTHNVYIAPNGATPGRNPNQTLKNNWNTHDQTQTLTSKVKNNKVYLFLESDNWYQGANIASINLNN